MEKRDVGRLICINCTFAFVMFACAYLLAQLQVFVAGGLNEHFLDYTDAERVAITNINAIAQLSFYMLLSLFHVYAIHRLVRCSRIKRLVVLNSVVFCIALIAINSVLSMLQVSHIYVYISMPSTAASMMIIQIALALLFLRSGNGAVSVVDGDS